MDQINELNQKHAAVKYGGQSLILTEGIDEDGKEKIDFSKPADFERWYCNRNILTPSGSTKLGKAWLEHPDRRQYDGVVFNPNGAPSNLYNLWKGFRIQPKEGDCSLYLRHIYEVIAAGDRDLAEYILDFMADAVQNPGKRPGVALVLRGDQGVGKGVFVKWFAELFKPHFAHVTNPNSFLGNFNSILDGKLLIFADEAFWAGDKKAEGTLKALITEETIPIEAKYRDVRQQKNFVRVIIASNNQWVIPAMANERRFCAMDVSDIHRQDTEYFSALNEQMENGGLEALMHLLGTRDLSSANLRKIPQTQALMDQKLSSMSPMESWWHDCLMRGYVAEKTFWDIQTQQWAATISVTEAYDSYGVSSKKRGMKNHLSAAQFGKELRKLVPMVAKKRVTLFDVEVTEPSESKARGYAYDLPPLDDCRSHFDKIMGLETDWPKVK